MLLAQEVADIPCAVLVLHDHLVAADAIVGDAVQQGFAVARHTAGLVAIVLGVVVAQHGLCTAPGCLDNRLRYAARLKVSSCQATRIWAGLRYPFFSISHSAL